MTQRLDYSVPDEAYEAAKKHFSDKEIVDLTLAVGLINAYNRIAISFRATPIAVKELRNK